jgi:hypothetical protein
MRLISLVLALSSFTLHAVPTVQCDSMLPQNRRVIKFVAGTVIVLGLLFSFIERVYSPVYIITDAPHAPEWVGWLGWILAAAGSVAYFLADIFEWLANRRRHRSPR